MPGDQELPLSGHLGELRTRLFRSLVAAAVGFAVCYPATGPLFAALTDPLFAAAAESGITATLIGTGVAEAFFTRLKVAFIAGVFLALPVLLHQAWKFTVPGLKTKEAQTARGFVIFGTFFFLSGATFCYYVVFPLGFPFLLGEYAKIGIDPAIRISEYLSFSAQMLLAFGITFELPVASFFLARVGVITHLTLIKYFRHAILAVFVLSAVLTPPDVASQILMAFPVLILYCLSIGVAYAVTRKTGDDAEL